MNMRATAYEGYFNNGRFYVSGKPVHIPEQRRIFITILDDVQKDTNIVIHLNIGTHTVSSGVL